MKTFCLIVFCCLVYTRVFPQQYYRYNQPVEDTNSIIFADTLNNFVTDSLIHDIGLVPQNIARLTKYFKYTGTEGTYIEKAWTGDPHYICEYPQEELIPGKIYSFEVCFCMINRPGNFSRYMGFYLSNGSIITFLFKGTVMSGK